MRRFLRRAWPWLLGLVILGVILSRVPLAAFGTAIHEGPHLQLALVDFAVVVGLLVTDSLATWVARVDDIRAVALPALRHRLLMNFEGEAEQIDVDTIVAEILSTVATE